VVENLAQFVARATHPRLSRRKASLAVPQHAKAWENEMAEW
jgi:hypothetical protein